MYFFKLQLKSYNKINIKGVIRNNKIYYSRLITELNNKKSFTQELMDVPFKLNPYIKCNQTVNSTIEYYNMLYFLYDVKESYPKQLVDLLKKRNNNYGVFIVDYKNKLIKLIKSKTVTVKK